MKSTLLIFLYFGQWPLWFEGYLVSLKANLDVNWLCSIDCEFPTDYPENLKFLKTSLPELNQQVNHVEEAEVPLSPPKFCDLKPAYGDIFQDEMETYDFWGFCDMDIIWGDIRKFMTPEVLENHDIISSRKENISGHFNLFKNAPELNQLYKSVPDYQNLFEQDRFMWFDEQVLSNYLKTNAHRYNIKWDQYLVYQENGSAHQEYELNRWLWNDGKLIITKTNQEVMYLHFINWKRTMSFCEISYTDVPKPFYVSYQGMHCRPHSNLRLVVNDFKNLFFVYNVSMKWKKISKKLTRKL